MRKIIFLLGVVCMSFTHSSQITIIGAGLSGLTCAYRLQQMGHQVTVFEALERPGGRVLTHYDNGTHEELGGKFLSDGHGASHVTALIRELKLEIDSTLLPFTKNYFNQGECFPFYSLFETLPSADDSTLNQLREIATQHNNLSDVLDQFFGEHTLSRRLEEIRLRNYEGSDTCNLSAKYFDLVWQQYQEHSQIFDLEKNNQAGKFSLTSVRGGNSRLIRALVQAIGDCIHYRMPLHHIQIIDNKPCLTFINGQQHHTDYVILTVPLPVLNTLTHSTRLPFGANAKILVPITPPPLPITDFSYTENGVTWFNSDYTFMTLYFGGSAADFATEDAPQIYLRDLPALQKLYPQIAFPPPEKVIGMSWCHEPFFQGSYSYYGSKEYDLLHETITLHDIPVKKVFAPIQDMIFIAGEAAALEYPATLEGAVEAAERISMLVDKVQKCR